MGVFTGWFGLGSFPDETLKFEKVEITGYPMDRENNNDDGAVPGPY